MKTILWYQNNCCFFFVGEGKQLQCLLKIRKSVTKDCRKILTERQELWKSVSYQCQTKKQLRLIIFYV